MANSPDPPTRETPEDVTTLPTLLEWAGGPDAITRLINAFYDRLETEPTLSPLFPGGVSADHRDHVARWWIEVFGGPNDYTTQLGGYENMLAHHRDLAITADQRARFASRRGQAADDAHLPEDPEFCAAFVGYPVPRWGRGVAPPTSPP